jgi:hypothetical protein
LFAFIAVCTNLPFNERGREKAELSETIVPKASNKTWGYLLCSVFRGLKCHSRLLIPAIQSVIALQEILNPLQPEAGIADLDPQQQLRRGELVSEIEGGSVSL